MQNIFRAPLVAQALLAIVIAPVTAVAATAGSQAAERPNIVLIYVDDLGYGDLAGWGHHTIETPRLDRLAREGIRFTHFYAPSALCSPSRAGLLTGRTPFRTGIRDWIPEDTAVQLGPREITLATLLEGVGYDTFLGGKWHLNGGLGVERHTQPEDHGFDHWLALHAFAIPHQHNPANFYRNGGALGVVEGYAAQITLDETLGWLDRQQATSEAPFFVYLATAEPHGTQASPPEFLERYARFTRGEVVPVVNGLPDPPENLEARGPGEYYANVTHLDFQIGRLLDWLEDRDLADDTLVIFASDNGPVTEDWRHWWEINLYGSTGGLRGRKADLYEGGIRVPAIVRWPGRVAPGAESSSPLSGYDVLPTLAPIAGFQVPTDRPIDGEDFGALLRGEAWERDKPLYWQFADDQGFHFALRSGRYKLLADSSMERVELYDLESDPFEVQDLAARRPQLREQLLQQLRDYSRRVASDPLTPAVGES